MSQPDRNDETQWYKDAIIYELHIKAFSDSNGDGIGDFKGLLQKLDYLEDLGVTAIWLLPFYPSPLRDDGYDIADYYSINPSYGNIRDFKRFIKEAHQRGLKVITELVINHTSDQHPWFQRARKANPGTPERDFYVWSDNQEKYKDARIIFTDTEPSNWSWDSEAKAYYWHRFFSHQPDLNFDNPKVQQEVFNILDFWCDLGVDGFRLDAVPYLFEREGTNCENLPETHTFLKKLRAHIDARWDNKLLLAEANMWPEDSAAYFGDGDECHMNYHFPIMPRMFMAVKMEDRYPILDIIDQTPEIPENCQWGIFLRNHDELTLEMVTDEERDYMYKVYTKDPRAKINVGIRHRLAPLLENNRSKIELMNVLLFSLPGTPVIYYGDEIGMGDNYYLGDRDGVRTPMQWTPDRNAGFSEANPHKLYLPLIIDSEYKYETINVETQLINSSSLLWWMKRIIGMRKNFKAFGRGSIEFLSPTNAKVIAFIRSYGEECLLVIGNLSRFPQPAELELQEFTGYTPVEVFSHNRFPPITDKPYLFTLAPYGHYWFLLQGEKMPIRNDVDIPLVQSKTWKELWKGRSRKKLVEKVLPNYLKQRDWFEGANRIIQEINIKDWVDLSRKTHESGLLFLEVDYNEGLPEIYQIPISLVYGDDESLQRKYPQRSIIAKIQVDEREGVLIDGLYDENFRNFLFQSIRKAGKNGKDNSKIKFVLDDKDFKKLIKDFSNRLLESDNRLTVIDFGHQYSLKLYRKLDKVSHPDVETLRFLHEKSSFHQTPKFCGQINYQQPREDMVTLALLQKIPEHQGDVWDHLNDSLTLYFEQLLTLSRELVPPSYSASMLTPISLQNMPKDMQNLLGIVFQERMVQLGTFTAQMHLGLSSHPTEGEFSTESFSLHYQRSLFSGLQTLTRTSLQQLKKSTKLLTEPAQLEAEKILGSKMDILKCLRKIYQHTIPVMKIRTHGDYHLPQILWTGKDYIINNFEGDTDKTFSDRKIRRSAMLDVASLLQSLRYVMQSTLLQPEYDQAIKEGNLQVWAEAWYYFSCRLFLNGYLEAAKGANFVPERSEDFQILTTVFMLEKALNELQYDLKHRPEWAIIPLMGIQKILESNK